MLVNSLQKTKKELKNLKKQEIQTIFTKINWIRLVFNMIWLMEILKILKKEQVLIKFYEIKHLILLKTINMMVIKEGLLLWFLNFLIKCRKKVVLI